MQYKILICVAILLFYLVAYDKHCFGMHKIDGIIAIVNEEPILESDIHNMTSYLNLENPYIYDKIQTKHNLYNDILNQLIVESIILQLATQTNININNNQINKVIDHITTENHITNEQLQYYLYNNHINYNTYRENIRKNIIINIMIHHEIDKSINILPNELQSLTQQIEKNNSTYQLEHIFIPFQKNSTQNQIKSTQNLGTFLAQEIKHGIDIKTLVTLYSNTNQIIKFKKINWATLKELPNLFANALIQQDLTKSKIIGPLYSNIGFHILKVCDIYTHNKQKTCKKVHLRNIVLNKSQTKNDQQIQKILLQASERIKNGHSTFYIEAKRISDDTNTANQGGDLGWKYIEDFHDITLQNIIQSLNIGEISQPIQTKSGWHLIQLLDIDVVDKNQMICEKYAYELIFNKKYFQEIKKYTHELLISNYIKIL